MECVLIILLISSVHFSVRFFLLSKNVKEAAKEFKEIHENVDTNRKLTFTYPDKNFEKLLKQANGYLEKTQIDRIRYIKREEEIRKEIENISHDLRTPLTSIRGYLELINDKNTTEEEKQAYISIVERKAKGLQNLIEIFYDLSRLEANDYKMNIEIVEINKELRELLLAFYNDFEKKGINVEVNFDKNQAYVQVDKMGIERVFINLIQNSIKYSKTSFKIFSEKIDRDIIFSFINDIQYMDKEEAKLLFNRFYIGDTSRNNQSSGLGLTVTKLLVETMGGQIEVEIEEGWIIFKLRFMLEAS